MVTLKVLQIKRQAHSKSS